MVEKQEKSGFFSFLGKFKTLWETYKIIRVLIGLTSLAGIGIGGYFATKPVTRDLTTKAEVQVMIDNAMKQNAISRNADIDSKMKRETTKVRNMIKDAIHKHECYYNKTC